MARIIKVPVDRGYPILRLTAEEFMALGEYSCTFPTGTTIGKRWRRREGAYDEEFIRAGGKPRWIVGEYYDNGKPGMVGVRWYKPVVIVRAEVRR